VTVDDDVEQLFVQHMQRLQDCLQKMSGSGAVLEEGSDAWLLLHILTENDQQAQQMLSERFEHSGRVLFLQGDELDSRLRRLQEYTDVLVGECQEILQDSPKLLIRSHVH
jgi:hypothetical protein